MNFIGPTSADNYTFGFACISLGTPLNIKINIAMYSLKIKTSFFNSPHSEDILNSSSEIRISRG